MSSGEPQGSILFIVIGGLDKNTEDWNIRHLPPP